MSVNKVILVGNVGKDPDVRYFDNDTAKASFSLATSERGYTGANGTQVPERTEWHNIICWRGLAQIVEKFVKKGTQLYIEGKIRYRSYDDQNGIKRYITEVYADNIEILTRRGASGNDMGQNDTPSAIPDNRTQTTNTPDVQNDNSQEDDLPF